MPVPEIALPEPMLDPSVYASTAKPKPSMTEEELANLEKPKVLIVGAGIGGLTLGILLKKGGIPFEIYERAKEVKSLGSALLVGSKVMTLLQQLQIYEEFQAIGKPNIQTEVYKEDLEPYFTMNHDYRAKNTGGDDYVVARPDLYDLLLRQIPKENLHLGKRIQSFEQNMEGVMIRCTDNTTHFGDILVGSDGAHSAVRQHLFHDLKKNDKLPASDDVPLPFTTVCLVGQTRPMDPEEYPVLKSPNGAFMSMLGFETPGKANDAFTDSKCGPEAAETMSREVRHLKVPNGKDGNDWTIGDIIDQTPKDSISKCLLEEKVFSTWYGGRTVLIGDACHKFNPAGKSGAAAAMHDAVALANWICVLRPKNPADINVAFEEYYKERFPIAKDTFSNSQMYSKLAGKDFRAMAVTHLLKRLPLWLWKRLLAAKKNEARPQVSFLPLVEDKGARPPAPQPSLYKTLALLETRAKAETKKNHSTYMSVAV
ncbi:hypothetical protein CPC16_001065 [Podila verticillata]|nr:hypothetical protein CPC16_001065 [Podila verticillata]